MVDIRRPTMAGDIHARHFVLGGDAQQPEALQQPEERRHSDRHPSRNDQNFDKLRSQQLASTSHEESVWSVTGASVDLQDVILLRKQAYENQPPCAAASVQLRRFQGVVVV